MLRTMCLRWPTLPFVLVGALLLPGCADDGNADATSGSSSSAATSSGSVEPTTTAPVTSSGTDTTAGTMGTAGTSATAGTMGTSADSTTGAEALCNGWSERGPDTPWLELYDIGGRPLASGGTYALECGGQGSWMFPIYPMMGGWELADPTLLFSVEVVVEGFPGPFGSFYVEPEYYYGLECFAETFDGGFAHDCIAVLPPDDIADLAALDGAPATIHIELAIDGDDPLVVDLVDMTISAPADVVAGGCGFG
jgi:hypothetical protein